MKIRKATAVAITSAFLAVIVAACSLFDRTTNPTTINVAQILNAGGSSSSPSPGPGQQSTLCGIPIQSVQLTGPGSFIHGSGAQNYSAAPLDASGNDLSQQCGDPFTATFVLTGVLSGTGSSVGPAEIAVNPTSAGSGQVSAKILSVSSQALTVQVQ